MEIEFAGVNFFKASPAGGLGIDWEVVDSLKSWHLVHLDPHELRFYNYISNLRKNPEFRDLHISGKGGPGILDQILDAPHSALCEEFLRAINSPDVDDHDLF